MLGGLKKTSLINNPVAAGMSSFRIVPCAAAVVMVAGADGLLRVTVNSSSGSTVVSPLTWIVMIRLLSPAENVTVPEGKSPPKSFASVAFAPLPVTAKSTVVGPLVSPLRVTKKVNAVRPLLPSGLTASSGAMLNVIPSSFTMVPLAAAVTMIAGVLGLLRVTVKPSSGSTIVSPLTATVIVLVVSSAANATVPDGSAPSKSSSFAGFPPLPVTE